MFSFLSKFKNLFSIQHTESEEEDNEYLEEINTRLSLLNKIEFKNLPSPEFGTNDPYFDVMNNKPDIDKKNILLVDDVRDISLIYKRAFRLITNYKCKYPDIKEDLNIYKDFNVYSVFEPQCGAIAFNFLKNNKIDFAILDLTLGYLTITDNGYINIDGVDLAIEIWRRYPQCHILFSTVHTLNKKNNTIYNYCKKFEAMTGKCLENYYLEKNNENIYISFLKFFYNINIGVNKC